MDLAVLRGIRQTVLLPPVTNKSQTKSKSGKVIVWTTQRSKDQGHQAKTAAVVVAVGVVA